MKKIISIILTFAMMISISSINISYAADNIYPPEGNDLGYLFSIRGENSDINLENFDGIRVVSDMANIYYSDTVAHIRAVENLIDIETIVENWEIEDVPDAYLDNYDDNTISLFSDDNTNSESLGTVTVPVETIVPDTTEMPVETASPINTEEPSGTMEPTQTEKPVSTELPEETSSPIEPTAEPEPTPNDLLYNWQWYYEAVNADAYRENNIAGKGVKVGIIDSGINSEHIDFTGVDIQIGINVCALIDNKEDRFEIFTDGTGHGTAVTSIIVAKTNNLIGISGIADECTIVPYKVVDSSCSTLANSVYSTIVALDLAYKDGCDVVNISMGCKTTSKAQIEMINSAVNAAIKNGMIIIAAVGNDGNNDETLNAVSYPAACENVIGVGAVQPDCEMEEVWYKQDTREIVSFEEGDGGTYTWVVNTVKDLPSNSYVKCDFSTANESVLISAPGKNIMRCTNSSSKFGIGHGTSDATPIVSAAAIGVKQMRPYVDTDIFKEILKATAVDLDEKGYDINTGYGMVDFEAIYNFVSEMPETIPEETPEIKIDYENNMLTGFDEDTEYSINDVTVTPEDGSVAIDSSWYGNTISVVRKSRGDGYTDSKAQELSIPTVPDAPTTVSAGYNKITGVMTAMEYKLSSSDTWISCSDGEISNLEAGAYDVRLKASELSFASKIAQIQVENTPQAEDTPNIAIDYKNHVLTGFDGSSEYLVNESIAVISNGKLNIVEAWYGNSISIVKNSRGDGYIDSEPQEVSIPTIPDAPTTVSAGYNKITGVKTTMEYKLSSSDTWISCSGTEIVNLDAGTYDVRTKATTKSFASKSVQVEVLDLPIKPTTPPLEKEYTIETSVYYDETNNRVVFSTTNNTENTIYATGVVAVYDTNGILKYIKTIKTFPKGTLNQSFVYDDANCKIKFFIWKDLQSLQPYPDVKSSEYSN